MKLRKRSKGIKDQLVRLPETERFSNWQVSDGLNYEGGGERGDSSLRNKMSIRKCMIQHHLHRWEQMLISIFQFLTPTYLFSSSDAKSLKLGLNIGAVLLIHHFCFHYMFSQFLEKEWTKIDSNNGIVNILSRYCKRHGLHMLSTDQNLDLWRKWRPKTNTELSGLLALMSFDRTKYVCTKNLNGKTRIGVEYERSRNRIYVIRSR